MFFVSLTYFAFSQDPNMQPGWQGAGPRLQNYPDLGSSPASPLRDPMTWAKSLNGSKRHLQNASHRSPSYLLDSVKIKWDANIGLSSRCLARSKCQVINQVSTSWGFLPGDSCLRQSRSGRTLFWWKLLRLAPTNSQPSTNCSLRAQAPFGGNIFLVVPSLHQILRAAWRRLKLQLPKVPD